MQLSDIDLAHPDNYHSGPPHHMFEVLRREAPVFWHPDAETPGFWALTRHAEVAHASRSPQLYSAQRRTVFMFESNEEDLSNLQMMLVNRDPPNHTKLRRLVSLGFTPRRIAMLEEKVRLRAGEIIDRVAARGECDFVTDLAADLPLQVIAELVGVPMEDRGKVFEWSNKLIGFDDPEYSGDREQQKQSAMDVYLYANQLAEKRREEPHRRPHQHHHERRGGRRAADGDGVRPVLPAAHRRRQRDHAQRHLRRDAGADPASGAARAADRQSQPDDDGHRGDPALGDAGELLPPDRDTGHRDRRPGGARGRQGGDVLPLGQPRRPRLRQSGQFDVARTPNDHLAFGMGTHFCLGNALARLEIKVMFEELLRRLPDIELAGQVERLRSSFINGIKRMPVRFTPEALRKSA